MKVRDLRRRWKPTKERLVRVQRNGVEHPLPIRIHRALSWLEAAENDAAPMRLDQRLVSLWISVNALYGRWDAQRCEPLADGVALRQFLDKVSKLDRDQVLMRLLNHCRPDVERLMADKFLNNRLWSRAVERLDEREDSRVMQVRQWYTDGAWKAVLRAVMDRIYFVRCQLVHGAATHRSKLNREAVSRSTALLDPLVRTFVLVVVDHGLTTDWGDLCYPPISAERR
ncbi:MAG: hypothetical protein KatS3mg111_0493 [Pirellulaceae bacterium]|nr:MAG: hypothetical protein KatS3mg111_0493 [Pirellulaceae bacterium]